MEQQPPRTLFIVAAISSLVIPVHKRNKALHSRDSAARSFTDKYATIFARSSTGKLGAVIVGVAMVYRTRIGTGVAFALQAELRSNLFLASSMFITDLLVRTIPQTASFRSKVLVYHTVRNYTQSSI